MTETDAEVTHGSRAFVTVFVLCMGGLFVALMQTLVIPIQPNLPSLLSTSAANASWVVTSTLLGAAVAMPIAGRLGDMLGKQRILLASSLLLVAGSLICALSDTLLPMLVGRTLQGLAMGFIPVGISLMREVTPPHLTATAVATMSATLGVGGGIGLPLSAWIAQSYDWHALFWTSVVLAVVMTVSVIVFVPHTRPVASGRLDVVGAVGLGVGLIATLVAVSKGNEWGWTSPGTLGTLVGGILVLIAWGWYELRHDEPLCDLRTTARPAVLFTNLAAIAIGFGMMAQSIVMPQLLEMPTATGYGLGQSLLATGLWLAPAALMMLVFAPISSGLINRFGARTTLLVAGSVLAAGYVVAFFLTSAPWQLLLSSAIVSAGVGIGYAAMPTLVMANVPASESGSAVGFNSLMRSIGSTTAAAVMATILTSSTSSMGGVTVPSESAFKMCFVVGAIAAVVAVVMVLGVPRAPGRWSAASPKSASTTLASSDDATVVADR